MSIQMSEESAHITLERRYSVSPARMTGRRPYLSLSGPQTSMDSAKKNMKPISVRLVSPGVA